MRRCRTLQRRCATCTCPPEHAVTRFIFRHGLLRAAYTREQLDRMAAESRFGCCEIVPRGIGLELRLTKDR